MINVEPKFIHDSYGNLLYEFDMPGVAPDALIFSLTSDEESSIVECEFVGLKNFVSGKKYLARLQIDTDVYTSGCYSLENGLLNITLHPKINGQPNFYWVSH